MKRRSDEEISAPLYEYDAAIRAQHGFFAGVDEAGRGPLCGPVVVAACTPSGVEEAEDLAGRALISRPSRVPQGGLVVVALVGVQLGLVNPLHQVRVNDHGFAVVSNPRRPYFYMISQNHYIINNNRNILRLFPCLQYIIQVRKVNRGYAEESLFHSA